MTTETAFSTYDDEILPTFTTIRLNGGRYLVLVFLGDVQVSSALLVPSR